VPKYKVIAHRRVHKFISSLKDENLKHTITFTSGALSSSVKRTLLGIIPQAIFGKLYFYLFLIDSSPPDLIE